jgi:hypothetical protein
MPAMFVMLAILSGNENEKLVEGDGFEPSKAMLADLQSAPFGHSGNPPEDVAETNQILLSI